ncbi:PLC-like phosphodiesterase [Podospora aff. communis PSN243]|uniref:PLC-like phosphodiesterase n=1 Tax=Podospora aff. communis PSN243 TaxID=3040156 RepID=A0AAV9G3T1_9PEZI|nr:PLC-like phosphodiesterase [Podospora aff. communis PSN243]
MSTFAFGDVKALQARQNKQVYVDRLGSTWGDSGGEVTYAIAGTDKRFEVQARAASVGGHPMREIFSFENLETTGTPRGAKLEFAKRGYRQYNMILTGSEAYGRYYDGFNPPVAWMSAILDVIGERKLRHVSMIGSHDAGMSVRTGGTVFGQAANCLTQGFGVYDQLIFGARFFDIRPVIGNGGRLVTGHYSTGLKQGCNGQFIDDIVRQINRFTAEHPELVILHLSHALNTEDDYRSMNSQEWDRVFDAFEGLTHRCGGISGDLTSKTMNSFIGNGRACVLVIANQPNVRPAQGIYNIREQFEWAGEGHWSDTDRAEVMAESQTRHLRENRKIMQGTSGDKFYVMQWVLTLQGIDNVPDDENPASIAIETIATRLAYDSLFWKGWNAMRPDSYPTVMLLDFIGVMQQFDRSELIQRPRSELIALAMAVNLAIASQNPWVGGGTIYKRG